MLKIVLILMIKNESLIMRRCIESVINFVDAFCITDTGSVDNTVDIALDIIKNSEKPGKLCQTIFRDFGTTRSESFNFSKEFIKELGWDLSNTFAILLDADMVLKIREDFEKSIVADYDECKIIQTQWGLEYNNTRFIRMSLDWKCIGSTHEYWQASQKTKIAILTSKKIWIDDISDGGCKTDKFERDIRLLIGDLEKAREKQDMINTSRSLFYLARSYYCIDDTTNAIKYFKERIDLGGWIEEVWHSYLSIAICYLKLNEIDEATKWYHKTWDIDNTRSEPLLALADIYSNKQKNEEAMKYIEMGIDIKHNPRHIIFTNVDAHNYEFLISKFKVMLKIPTTTKRVVLKTGLELLCKLPKVRLREFEYVIKVINDLSSPLDFISVPFQDTLKGVDYFIEPCLDRVDNILSLEKIGSSFIFVEYGSTKRYSYPFIFLKTPHICRKFYRDIDGCLTFIIQTRESVCMLKLINDPELN
jgi:hypothetical protein